MQSFYNRSEIVAFVNGIQRNDRMRPDASSPLSFVFSFVSEWNYGVHNKRSPSAASSAIRSTIAEMER